MGRTATLSIHVEPTVLKRVSALANNMGMFRSVLLAQLVNEGAKSRSARDPKFARAMKDSRQ